MKSSKNLVYKDFFSANQFVQKLNVYSTIWRGRKSKNSFSLKNINTRKEKIPQILQRVFGIENKSLFNIKYEEAISGDGQEWKRITTLHSSSLIALLCFYSVSKEHPLKIDCYNFDESFFEVKTIVHDSHKSNMDVVLRGENTKTGKKAVLFLESKFTEYLACGKKSNISIDVYDATYNKLLLFDKPIKNIRFGKNDDGIFVEAKKPIYCGGIKQMLSHYMGVSNYATHKCVEHNRFKYVDGEEILLGEIMFDFKGCIVNSAAKLQNYKETYSELAKRINGHQHQVRMLDEVMTYQEIFTDNFIKEENIRLFYNL